MHVISEMNSSGGKHIVDDWPDWISLLDDVVLLRKLGYMAFGTELRGQFVIVMTAKPTPVLYTVQ